MLNDDAQVNAMEVRVYLPLTLPNDLNGQPFRKLR